MTSFFVSTFNCGKLTQDTQYYQHLSAELAGIDAPHVLLFGYQELCSIPDGCLGYAVDPLNDLIQQVLKAIRDQPWLERYVVVGQHTFGAMGLVAIASADVLVTDVKLCHVACGMFWSSLKGAVGLRLNVDGNPVVCVAAHLAANEGFLEQRNDDFATIAKEMKFLDPRTGIYDDATVFFLGDLNYRASENEQGLADYKVVDELFYAMRSLDAFWDFQEAEIGFKPTYKFHTGTSEYNTKRIPSWCDRVLYRGAVVPRKYDSIPAVMSSDHKPVYLWASVKLTQSTAVEQGDVPPHILSAAHVSELLHIRTSIMDYIIALGLLGFTTRMGWISIAGFLLFAWALYR
ncbi:Endonuclease/exonuclease/phosphatase [Yarrowia lipolytica]|jgi:hypothetical protein|uniref:YALI0F12177p n=2 Tax=Yarrowia lipolytica TaxID=4952 RepID=Q6C1Z2_YARLI|nr:YALI0F12177p [Yarrowia lipolytica CLIB122]AOW07039.1 hypothetical protein YALI1_F16045g [Yarrowia lipolytica]KAB8282197.1 Endonuclease/exonuclease/phosphatase [Yarrowia lipolytica]KAE8172817.1 Endonuclease/exonuclease/phosphatase [Yarrowia lipolytica]KAJ8055804.1 Endonuclease/exonuclease/phosphatase [Yarrowia lipolytica]QNQ00692.1 Type IV inositol polyphosphate 5-phosphatase 11 [Yarrowia lipolytica]|eukprot:XP_505320.1 YALI0F12177p [Yarrowia lipolytica CLIB122]